MTPEVRAVANALLAAQCPTGVCVRDVTDHDPTLRMRLELMARNLLANPRPLLDALSTATEVARCDVCGEPSDDMHSATVDGVDLDFCWRCCPDCPTRDGAA